MPEIRNLSPEQKEQARHGGRLFPLEKYITTLSALHPLVPAHWHEEAELTLITEGECTYQIHLEPYEAKAGDLLFLPPAILHSVALAAGEEMRSDTYVFHMGFLGADSADICAVRYLVPITRQDLVLPFLIKKEHPAYSGLLRIFRQINDAYEAQRPGYELTVKSLLMQAVGLLIPYASETESRARTEDEYTSKLKLVLEYIGEHYTEDLTISRLAKLCFFSEYHFMRFFKKYTGTSCLEYIKNLRLEHAARLFTRGESNILEVSLSAGFSNLSYFYREFKKKYGMTPRKFIEEKPDRDQFSPMQYR